VITQVQEQKQDTGHVGSGNMRIDEFTSKKFEKELPFSVTDDLMVFMRNDPHFYRKSYYPCMVKMQDESIKGNDCNFVANTRPMIKSAIKDYCTKFNVAANPQSVFTKEDEDAIIEKLYDEEMPKLESGEY
jgi:hypothetical protein